MIVKTLKHGKAVFERLLDVQKKKTIRYLVLDTETQPKAGYTGPKDALVWGRAEVVVWSLCYRAESYCFPTSNFDPCFPTMHDWADLLRPYVESPDIIKVGHNLKYDIQVFETSVQLERWRNVWCTLVGAWVANMAVEKGLKSRAPLYGRSLRKTSSVDFSALEELGLYAEEDVVQTDELFQMQYFGQVNRPTHIVCLKPDLTLQIDENRLPAGKQVIPLEHFDAFQRNWYDLHEMPVWQSVRRAERRGFPYNITLQDEIRDKLQSDKAKLLKRIYQTFGSKVNLDSPAQLAKEIKKLGIRNLSKTKKGAVSVGAPALFALLDKHPIIKDVLAYRKVKKLETVYVAPKKSNKGLLHYVAKDGRIHCTLNTVGAVTGRFSAQLPNLTQIPSQADVYGIKRCFCAPKGYRLVCLDFAQLEIRVMAIMCKDPAMSKILRDPKGDIHQNTADKFGVERSPTAKQINFLMLYGGGAYMLGRKLTLEGVPTEQSEAKVYIETYDEVYCRVREFRKELLDCHKDSGYIQLLTGRKRWLPDINWDSDNSVHKAETTLSNNCIQGSGQDLLKAAIIRSDPFNINPDREALNRLKMPLKHTLLIQDYARRLDNEIRPAFKKARVKWLLQVHDESLWLVDEKAVEDIGPMLADLMCWNHYFPPVTSYSVPIVVEGGVGNNWKEAKSKTPLIKLEAGFHQ